MTAHPARKKIKIAIAATAFLVVLWAVGLVYLISTIPEKGHESGRIFTGSPHIRDIDIAGEQLLVASGGIGVSLTAFDEQGETAWIFSPDPRPQAECRISGYGICFLEVTSEVIYAGAGDGVLYALSRSGELLWKHDTAPAKRSRLSPFMHPDGQVYTMDGSGNLCAFTPVGDLTLSVKSNRNVLPLDGIVWDEQRRFRFIDANSDEIVCQNEDGIVDWTLPLPGDIYRLSYAPDGAVYALVDWKDLYCVSPEGDVLWSNTTGETFLPAIDESGKAYISDGSQIVVFSPDGTKLHDFGYGVNSSFSWVVIHNDRLYVEGTLSYPNQFLRFLSKFLPIKEDWEGSMNCFDLDGKLLWTCAVHDPPSGLTAMEIDANGCLYLPRTDMSELQTGNTSSFVLKLHGP